MSEEVSFEYVKGLKDDETVLLIDVREPSELEKTGIIPGSINIPLGGLDDTFNISEEEFQTKFNRLKPKAETPIVFVCQIGRRSKTALDNVKELGYVNVKHYPGGWVEWEQAIKEKK